MEQGPDAYLDIETTGLSCEYAGITVIGIYMVNGADDRLVQLVGMDVTASNLLESLAGVSKIYTYNGSRFDLPFIHGSLDVDLEGLFSHQDLMLDCWSRNLYGGFKAVEQQLGIPRKPQGVSGWDAVRLWWQYAALIPRGWCRLCRRSGAPWVRHSFDRHGLCS